MGTALRDAGTPTIAPADRDVGVRVLGLAPADLTADVPLWESAVPPGDVGVCLVDGTVPEWNEQAAADPSRRRACSELAMAPVVTVAVVRGTGLTPAVRDLAAACDLVVCDTPEAAPDRHVWGAAADDLSTTIDGVIERLAAAPLQALVAAQLLRSPARIATESFAYSMLLAGGPFLGWREATTTCARLAADEGRRVRVEVVDGISLIRLCRVRKHNAFDGRMREELCDALDAVASAGTAPTVILGDGPSFCSGGDLDEFGLAPDPVVAHVVRSGRSVARRLERISDRLVVGVHGHCIGAGVELSAYARVVLAATPTTLALPELALGLNLGAGGSVSIPRRIGRHRTLELLLRAVPIDASTALGWGLLDEIVASDELERHCLAVAADLRGDS